MSATIRDIKQKTGLSLATISKYLNGGNVLPENRTLIENAIEELHYEVNEIARGLVTNKTRTIGVLVYSIESMFCGYLLHYIGESLRCRGYGMLICDSNNDESLEAEGIRFLLGKKVDGILVIPVSTDSAFLDPARRAGIPVVLVDRSLDEKEYDCVRIDNRAAAYRAVSRLVLSGHRNIAIIGSSKEYTGIERWRGYKDAVEEAGITIPEEYVKLDRHAFHHGYRAMKELLSLPKRPSAVFMTNYEVSLGAVMTINESRLNWPEDISLMGFDDLILAQVVEPKLCMVVQPMQEIGMRAVDLLLERISGNVSRASMEIVLGTRILEGNSIRKLN